MENKRKDNKKYPYKLMDKDHNIFVYSHEENNLPIYRGDSGCKIIFDYEKYNVIEF